MLENDAPKDFDVTTYIQNFLAGKAFISTGPVIRITATSETGQGTLGDLIPTTGALGLDIEVQTPTWYKVDTLNLYLNQTFVNPGAESDDADYEDLEPDITLSLLPEVLEWSNGGSTYRYRAELEISSEELGEKDGWLVAEVTGNASTLYPVSLSSGSATLDTQATQATDFISISGGAKPFVLTNPIYIDRDSDGKYNPRFAMQPAP